MDKKPDNEIIDLQLFTEEEKTWKMKFPQGKILNIKKLNTRGFLYVTDKEKLLKTEKDGIKRVNLLLDIISYILKDSNKEEDIKNLRELLMDFDYNFLWRILLEIYKVILGPKIEPVVKKKEIEADPVL